MPLTSPCDIEIFTGSACRSAVMTNGACRMQGGARLAEPKGSPNARNYAKYFRHSKSIQKLVALKSASK